jgi:hypothetical protein
VALPLGIPFMSLSISVFETSLNLKVQVTFGKYFCKYSLGVILTFLMDLARSRLTFTKYEFKVLQMSLKSVTRVPFDFIDVIAEFALFGNSSLSNDHVDFEFPLFFSIIAV